MATIHDLPDFLQTVHPRTGDARQTKLYLSRDGFDRLKSAAYRTGLDMSVIVDTLLTRSLPPVAKVPPKKRRVTANEDLNID